MRFIDRQLPRSLRITWWCVVCLVPLLVVGSQYDRETGFKRLLYFGSVYFQRALPEVRRLQPPVESPLGYDAQFYSQLAVDPLLRQPGLKGALDIPAYRARRIGLPLLAHLLGFGKPSRVVRVYCLLNVVFWYALLVCLHRFVRPLTLRQHLCVTAICLTSGVLFSMQRALLDLPAATLGFCAASLAAAGAVPALLGAILTKDTYALAFAALPGISPGKSHRLLRMVVRIGLVLLPVLGWYLYVRSVMGNQITADMDFSWPFSGYLSALQRGWTSGAVQHSIGGLAFAFTEMCAPLSLLVQLGWLAAVPRPGCRWWRYGIAFGAASVFLSREPFVEQMSYCRDTIAMTLAFNLGLIRSRPAVFVPIFVAGNVGLFWGVATSLFAWF